MDKEQKQFEADLLKSVRQAKKGEGTVHTPEAIQARRGRPPAALAKIPVKLRLDPDVLTCLRESGRGWQTRVNDLLRDHVFGKGSR